MNRRIDAQLLGVQRFVTVVELKRLKLESGDKSPHSKELSCVRTSFLAITLAISLAGCGFRLTSDHFLATQTKGIDSVSLTQEEKHRLYSAALAASDAPLDAAVFKQVCRQIGIFDQDGNPNGSYMTFVQQHVQWSMTAETNQFRSEISTKEKAQEYVLKHLP